MAQQHTPCVRHRSVKPTLVCQLANKSYYSRCPPGVVRRQDHVSRTENDVFAFNAGEIATAQKPETAGARRVLVRGHDFVDPVETVGHL